MYAIDAWGNLYQKNPCNGTVCPTKTFSDSLTVSVSNNKNQFDAYAYDANGNLTNDQLGHAFTYDAENRPYGGGGANYYYDGEGERVAKSNGTLYWFGTNSAPVLETDLTGLAVNKYIFANGKRWAMRHNGSFFYFTDQVGSAQVVADSGSLQQAIEYHPYGEERVISNFLGNNYRFTGKEHDSETNDDYFGARYYGSWSGRFLTPDWAATPVPVPYAQLANPQTLNLYSYVENNPITGTDPDGHDGAMVVTWTEVWAATEAGEMLGPQGAIALGGVALSGWVATHGGGNAYPAYYHGEFDNAKRILNPRHALLSRLARKVRHLLARMVHDLNQAPNMVRKTKET